MILIARVLSFNVSHREREKIILSHSKLKIRLKSDKVEPRFNVLYPYRTGVLCTVRDLQCILKVDGNIRR